VEDRKSFRTADACFKSERIAFEMERRARSREELGITLASPSQAESAVKRIAKRMHL
jgi:hypothetical protein